MFLCSFMCLYHRSSSVSFTLLQVELSQEALQVRVDATAIEVRAFARGYASAVEAHCLSLLRRLEELRVQRRYEAAAPGFMTVMCGNEHVSSMRRSFLEPLFIKQTPTYRRLFYFAELQNYKHKNPNAVATVLSANVYFGPQNNLYMT